MAMERQAGLESKRVPSAKSSRLHAGRNNRIPKFSSELNGNRNLYAVFAGVPSTGDDEVNTVPIDSSYSEAFYRCDGWADSSKTLTRFWALHREDRSSVGHINCLYIAGA
jgi:hypothetical protein